MELKDFKSDQDAVVHWQKTNDPNLLAEMMVRFRPVVASVANRYMTTGMSPAAVKTSAQTHMLKALRTYDPSFGSSPSTYITSSLQSIQRGARNSLISGSIPEHRNMRAATYNTVKQGFIDQFGRDPSHTELADELSWAPREVERMEKELGGEVGASKAESDFFGHSTSVEHQDRALVDFLYQEVGQREKTILEHTFGIGGKKILSNKDLAAKLNTYEMDITRTKRKLGQRVAENRR